MTKNLVATSHSRLRRFSKEELFQLPDHPRLRHYMLYESAAPVSIRAGSKILYCLDDKLIDEVIDKHRRRTARSTSELYGPSHPQSFENLYPDDAIFEELMKGLMK